VQWAPDLIETYVRTGRADDAVRVLERFSGEAEATGRTWALAAAARGRGLLAPDDAFEAEFAEALTRHAETTEPFELARTQLSLGERRRRTGRRADARAPLRAALAAFERLGAVPWAERARSELRAAGETVHEQARPIGDLTPHELKVALVVARGATNKEAAAELFLSPKTIDYHLGHVYRKLGVRSRTQLARLLADQAR
jgi:DNA-binding CsgD family transcriptional regulator